MGELKISEVRIDGQVQTLYPTVPQVDMAKGETATGETVQTNLKLVEPVGGGGLQVSLPFWKDEKWSAIVSGFGGGGRGSHFWLAHAGGGVGVEKSFTDDATWSAAVVAGYRGNFILDASGTTHGPYLSAELSGCGFFHPNLALVGGTGIYAPAGDIKGLEQFYSIGLRWIMGNNGNNGGNTK